MAKKKQSGKTRPAGPDSPSVPSHNDGASEDGVRTPLTRRPLSTAEAPASRRKLTHRDTLTILAFGVLVAVCYFPATQAGFVWDDEVFTKAEPIRHVSGLWNIWFSPSDLTSEGHYWPLVYTSFWLEHKLWGFAPVGYHIVNVLLHLVNVLVLWRLMLRLAVPGAWMIAAVFAVHPLHVESVAWVIERKDLLSALFYLTAVLTWLRFVEEPRRRHYLGSLALFVAGLLSKSIVVTLPVALLIWHWWKQGHVTKADLLRLLPFFLVGLCIVYADWLFYSTRESISFGYSMMERGLIAARALWFYAGKLLWPTELAVIYPHWDLADPLGWGYVVAAAVMAVGLYCSRHRIGRGPLAGALFFAVTLSPVLGFIDYGYMQFSFVADRFQYLAGIGVLAVLVGGVAQGVGKLSGVARWGVQGIALGVIIVLGVLTYRQAGVYRNEVTFYGYVVSRNPQARGAYANFGKALLNLGKWEESLAVSLAGMGKDPDTVKVYSNAAVALLKLKRFDEAERYLRRALKIEPRNPNPLQNLGEVFRKQGRYEEALEWYQAALESDADFVLTHAGLGDALFRLMRYDEAIGYLERAVALLPPDSPMARSSRELLEKARVLVRTPDTAAVLQRFRRETETLLDLAESFRIQKRYEESLTFYRAAIQNDADLVRAHAGLGDALFRLKRYDEAGTTMKQALALQPDSSLARVLHFLIAEAARETGQLDEATEYYERALHIDPRFAQALNSLASLRFEQQRYEEALERFRTLVEIDPQNANAHSNVGAVLYLIDRPEEALQSFDRALALDPTLESARTNREQVRKSLQRSGP